MWRYILGIPIVLAILAFAYYAISPVFIDVVVDESIPSVPVAGAEDSQSSVMTLAAAPIVDTPAHPAQGTAKIIDADGKTYLRYEEFKTLNGPDLYVYLAKDIDANSFVDLGRLRATEGNVNYEIPKGVNPSEYPYALVWCRAFGVLFNSAKLY